MVALILRPVMALSSNSKGISKHLWFIFTQLGRVFLWLQTH